MNRWIVVDRSISGHCCFGYTVVDSSTVYYITPEYTRTDVPNDRPYYDVCLCETYTDEDAHRIANALNALETD